MGEQVKLTLGTVEAADRKFYEDLLKPPLSGSIWTYPDDEDPNQQGIYETCRRLEEVGLLESRRPEGGGRGLMFIAKEKPKS